VYLPIEVLIRCVVALATISAIAPSGVSQPPGSPVQNGPAGQQAADLNTIINRLEKAQAENRQHYRAYTVVREYRLFSKGNQTHRSEVTAEVSFVPPDTKTFQIEKATGISRGEKITRSLLEHEVQAMKEPKQSSFLSRESYDFTYLGTGSVQGHLCYVLGLHPKYKRSNLVEGQAWIDQTTSLPRYTEGDLSKIPSWWLKKVHVKLFFDELDGMWLETGTQAVAAVRWFGEHTFTSRTIDFRAASSDAHQRAAAASNARPNSKSKTTRPSGGNSIKKKQV